jgi:hypothetical protein
MEVGHGQEKSEEGKEGDKEEEESSRPEGGGEAGQAGRQEGGGQEGRSPEGIGAQESGRPEASAARDADGGPAGARDRSTGSFHGGDAGGEDGAESCRGLAVPDGLEALNAPRMNCGRSGAQASGCTADIRSRGESACASERRAVQVHDDVRYSGLDPS